MIRLYAVNPILDWSVANKAIRMCEEVREPATQVPKAMVATVAFNTVAGLVFLIPLVFVLPDQAMLAGLLSGQPTPVIIREAVGSPGGAIGLLFPLLVLGLLCGIGCTTAASRATWAFSRDGAIPGFKLWKVVNTKLDVPLNAMMLSMVVQIALGLIYFGAAAAFNAFSGVGVICLTLSYAAPIFVSLVTGRKQVKDGPFYLGKLGTFCNVVALGESHLSLLTRASANKCDSLVSASHSAVLHAHLPHSHPSDHELRLRRPRRCCRRLYHLVLCLGQEELRGTANA
jgi:amino acid transporter